MSDLQNDQLIVLDPDEVPEAEWVVIRKVASSLFAADGKKNYAKACIQAYLEWLEYTNDQVRH